MNNIIELDQLTKRYKAGNVLALDQLTLSIPEKSITSVTGKSGCGKTTLLNMLGGLDTPSSGKVRILNTDITNLPESLLGNFRAENIGFVFQFFNLISELTALENIIFPLAIRKKHINQKDIARITELLEIKNVLDRLPSQLSGGQQQRVAIARAVIHSPKLLLMDEPTGNLDEENSEKIKMLITKLRDELGITILFVTHDKEMANAADRVIRLRDGHIDEVLENV